MTNTKDHAPRMRLPSNVPASTRKAMVRAVYRSLMWQGADNLGARASDAPPILAASYIPGPGAPAVEDIREALRAAQHAFAQGGALLLLSDHADTRAAARLALLNAYPAAGRHVEGLPN